MMPAPNYVSLTGYIGEPMVTLSFDAALDSVNGPQPGDFHVWLNGTWVQVVGVVVEGAAKAVKLVISEPLLPGDIVDVTYVDPSAGNDTLALQGVDGLDVESFAGSAIVVIPRPQPPSVVSIARQGAETVSTYSTSISYTVTFSQSVMQVDALDFTVTGTGTATGSVLSVVGSGSVYVVTVANLAGDGTLRLDLNASGTGIVNGSSVEIAGGYTTGQTFVLDHTAPAAPPAPQLSASSDTGVSNSDGVTSITTPTFTGTAEAGASVILYDTDGATVLGVTTADGAGAWTITSSTLASGSHMLTVRQTDAAGNASVASAPLVVTVDTSPPTAAITSNVASLKAGESATITFTFSEDPGASFSPEDLVVTGGTLGEILGSGLTRMASFTPASGINGGSASIALTAQSYTDAAGNAGAGASLTLPFDTSPPTAPSILHLGGGDAGNATTLTTPTVTGTAEDGATVTLYGSDGLTILGSAIAVGGAWSITTSPLTLGQYRVTAVATDAAGNIGQVSAELAVTIAPPVQAAIDALGFGATPRFDAAQVEADIGAGVYTYAQFVDQLVAEVRDTALPAVVVTAILGQERPSEAHLSDLIDFTSSQLAAYQQAGVARPELGPYEALGVGFSDTEAFRLSYAGLSDGDFSQSAYMLVFNRAPTQAQLDHFNSQMAYFEGIYLAAGIGAAEADLRAKGAAIGQMIGHTVLDEPVLHSFDDAANAFLQQVAMGQANFGAPLALI
jgi:hypothetical protein